VCSHDSQPLAITGRVVHSALRRLRYLYSIFQFNFGYPMLKRPTALLVFCSLLQLTLLASGFAAASNSAKLPAAQTSGDKIEEVEVQALRLDSKLEDLPFAISHIDKQRLNQARNLTEALQGLPGISVQKTANGQGSPFIRGFTGYRTLALIDGIRYNNSVYRDGPNEYFSLIDSQSITSLEAVNGPAATLYGSDAIGGSLNLHTASSSFEEETGSFISGQQKIRWASAEGSLISRTQIDLGQGEEWGLLLGVSYKDFGNVRAADLGELPQTGYQERAIDGRFDTHIGEHWTFTAVHQDLNQDDVWRTHSTIFSRSFAGTTVGDDLHRSKDQQRKLSYIKLTADELAPNLQQLDISISQQQWQEDGLRIKSNGQEIIEYFDSLMDGVDVQLQSHIGSSQWLYGFDYYRDNVDTSRREYKADGSLDKVAIQGPVGDGSRFSQFGSFVQLQQPLSPQWKVLLGTRYSIVRASVGRFESPDTGLPSAYAQQWDNLSSSIKISWENPDDTLQAWFGVSQAFRAPNIADLSRFGKSRSNEIESAATGLEPEKFVNTDLGLLLKTGSARVQINAFYTEIDNYISSTATGKIVDGLTQVSKANSGSGYVSGVELKAQLDISSQWQGEINGSWQYGVQWLPYSTTEVSSNSDSIKSPFSRSMPVSASISLNWNSLDYLSSIDFSILHSNKANRLSAADRQDSERIPLGGTPAYTVLNLKARHQLTPSLMLNMELNNVSDEAYRSHGSGSNEPGLGLVLGFDWRF